MKKLVTITLLGVVGATAAENDYYRLTCGPDPDAQDGGKEGVLSLELRGAPVPRVEAGAGGGGCRPSPDCSSHPPPQNIYIYILTLCAVFLTLGSQSTI